MPRDAGGTHPVLWVLGAGVVALLLHFLPPRPGRVREFAAALAAVVGVIAAAKRAWMSDAQRDGHRSSLDKW